MALLVAAVSFQHLFKCWDSLMRRCHRESSQRSADHEASLTISEHQQRQFWFRFVSTKMCWCQDGNVQDLRQGSHLTFHLKGTAQDRKDQRQDGEGAQLLAHSPLYQWRHDVNGSSPTSQLVQREEEKENRSGEVCLLKKQCYTTFRHGQSSHTGTAPCEAC